MPMTHARREQIAREQGFASYAAKRRATPEQRIEAAGRMAATSPTYARAAAHQIGRGAVGGRQQIFPTAAGVVVTSGRNDVLLSQIRRAADRDEVIRARFTAQGRSIELWGKGGYSAEHLFDAITGEHRTTRPASSPIPGDKSRGDVADALARFASAVYGAEPIDPDEVGNVQLVASPT